MARHTPKGRRWHALRHAMLERDGWQCRACGARGVRLEIDHITPVSVDPARKWDPANMQALCVPCHLAKTDREQGRSALSLARRGWRHLLRDVPAPIEQTRRDHA